MKTQITGSLTLLLTALSIGSLQAQPKNQPATPVPAGVTAHRDLAYVANGHSRQKLDLYVPEKAAELLPVIIWVHGGGWQAGSKDQCPPLRGGFIERGYAIASIGYRLSDDAIFPAQIEDCKAALRWLRAHAQEYHLDVNRFGVWGSSAGGHLVALLGTSGEEKAFDTGANLAQSSQVQAVCDFYGPTDFSVFVSTPGYESHQRADAPEGKLIGGAVLENKEKAARPNPINYITKNNPPFFIAHGDKDPTVPINQSQLLFEALKQAGVSVHFHTIHGAGHGGPGFNASEVNEMVNAFFDRYLKAKTPAAGPPEVKTSESTATNSGPQRSLPAQANRPRITFEQILAREDANGDGKVTRSEFKGPPQLFDRLDRNHDGVLTKEDFDESATPAKSNTK